MASSSASTNSKSRPWWRDVVCYQIWPMSFKDSNSDGHGDLQGVISKLDYLQDLGIDCIWISPTYKSPMKDYGYDISDYQDMNPKFGTMEDMKQLIQEVHQRGMRILMDLVVTHTSDDHAWFQESRLSKDSDKADWYIWENPRRGHKIANTVTGDDDLVEEPTNWRACFGGSAWKYVPERDQYYLHLFMESQPDLNWETLEVRKAICDEAIGFWLDYGVDGFRIDTINRMSKRTDWPDAPVKLPGKLQPATQFYINGPRSHEFVEYMQEYMVNHPSVKESGRELMLVGELPSTGKEDVLRYVHPDSKELSMVFDFDMVKLGGHDNPDVVASHEVMNLCDGHESYTLPEFKRRLKKVQDLIADGGWGTIFMENHDQCRSIARYATPDPAYRMKAAKLLCLMQATLSGTQFIYQGQEIGMTDMPADWGYDEFKDHGAKAYLDREGNRAYAECGPKAREAARERARKATLKFGRDNGRTLVQWTGGKHGGFSDTDNQCWIGVNPDCDEGFNVEVQQKDPDSIWSFWKAAIKMRKEYREIFMHGSFALIDEENPHIFTYLKTAADGKQALVCLNFSDKERSTYPPGSTGTNPSNRKFLLGNSGIPGTEHRIFLHPWEGQVYLVSQNSLLQNIRGRSVIVLASLIALLSWIITLVSRR